MAEQDPNKELQETIESVAMLKDAFNSLGAVIKAQITNNIAEADDVTKILEKTIKSDLTSAFNQLGRYSDKLIENSIKNNQGLLSTKEITEQILSLEVTKSKILASIEQAQLKLDGENQVLNADQAVKLNIQLDQLYKEQLATLQHQGEVASEIEERLGRLPAIFKSISKIPILGGLLNAPKAVAAMQQAAAAGANKLEILKEGLQAALDPFDLAVTAMIALGKAGLQASKQTADLAKSLVQSEYQAAQTRDSFAAMARESGDSFLTTEKLVQSTLKLGQQLGIASTFSADLTKEFTTLTQRIGLSEEAAGGLAKASIITGRSLKSIKNEAAGAVSAISAQYGVQLNIRDVLEKAGKSSSLLLANFKGNPIELAKAVAEMEELGTSLETTQKQANALLDWQTSIQNTLEASLITGRNINLDKARELALNNDLVGAAKELVNQQMDYNTFSDMNAIQRTSFAKSLGLETQELSDQLLKLEYMGKSRKEVAALAGEEAAKRLETLNAQEKFNNAVEKLKDIFVALMDGPIGQLLGLLTDVLGVIGKIGAGIAKAIPAPILKILAGVGAGAAIGAGFGGAPGALVGAGVGLVGSVIGVAANSGEPADDLMSNYGDRTLVTPQGAYALNNNDTVIAGTNLFRGNDVYSGPQGAINMTPPEFDYSKLAQAMSNIRLTSVSKPSEFAPFISKEQNKAIGVKI
jgi:hypothetical protein